MATERFVEEFNFDVGGKLVKIEITDFFDPRQYRQMLGLDGGTPWKMKPAEMSRIATRLYRNSCITVDEVKQLGGRLVSSSEKI
jgi:hypothetical protein